MLEAIKTLGKNVTHVADIVHSFLITNVDSQTSEVFKINLLQISYRQTRKEKDSWVIENAIRGYDNDEFSTSALQLFMNYGFDITECLGFNARTQGYARHPPVALCGCYTKYGLLQELLRLNPEADLNFTMGHLGWDDITAVHHAILTGMSCEYITILQTNGIDVNQRSGDGRTLLELALFLKSNPRASIKNGKRYFQQLERLIKYLERNL